MAADLTHLGSIEGDDPHRAAGIERQLVPGTNGLFRPGGTAVETHLAAFKQVGKRLGGHGSQLSSSPLADRGRLVATGRGDLAGGPIAAH